MLLAIELAGTNASCRRSGFCLCWMCSSILMLFAYANLSENYRPSLDLQLLLGASIRRMQWPTSELLVLSFIFWFFSGCGFMKLLAHSCKVDYSWNYFFSNLASQFCVMTILILTLTLSSSSMLTTPSLLCVCLCFEFYASLACWLLLGCCMCLFAKNIPPMSSFKQKSSWITIDWGTSDFD